MPTNNKNNLQERRYSRLIGRSCLPVLLVVCLFMPSIMSASALSTGSNYMIAIIVTSDDPNLESEFAQYNAIHGLPPCTVLDGCLQIAKPFGTSSKNPATSSNVAFFVEQAHAVNPSAKILVVEARSTSWQDKWDASEYAKNLPGVQRVTFVSYSKIMMEIGLMIGQ